MNLFLEYQNKIFKCLKDLEKRGKIKIPPGIKSFNVELPPKDQKADMSCNAAMVLAKVNRNSPTFIANIIKVNSIPKMKVMLVSICYI